MTETVFRQLLRVRSEGLYNMFSVNDVQRRAYELGFYDLVLWIEKDNKRYFFFIMTGELPAGEKNPASSPQSVEKNGELLSEEVIRALINHVSRAESPDPLASPHTLLTDRKEEDAEKKAEDR